MRGVCILSAWAVGSLQAFVCAARAAPAVAAYTQIAAQVLERAGAIAHCLMNLALGDGLANANVHEKNSVA